MTQNKKLITHNGSFHADDIFACAVLSLMLEKNNEKFEVIRTRDEEIIKNGDYVFDVGGVYDEEKDRFDHHQKGGAGQRGNGIEYSSFGLVWKKFGIELCDDQKVVDIIDKRLTAPIDAGDNGIDLYENKFDISPYLLQGVFFAMHPTWREEDLDEDAVFLEAVDFAKKLLLREIVQASDALLAEDKVVEIYNNTEDKRILVLDNNYPVNFILQKFPEPVFVIYPRNVTKEWGVKTVRADLQTFDNRKDLPVQWGGLMGEELQKISGVSDAVFCHRALFFTVAESKEGAIKLAQIALES